MENKKTVAETLRRILVLEKALNDITEISDNAFKVFSNLCSRSKMERIFNSSWQSLFNWNDLNRAEIIPYLHLQDYHTVEHAFLKVESACINREEFSNALAESRESVARHIEQIKSILSKEKKKLEKLYNEFAESTGSLKFIFEEPQVKQLILDNLLKS